MTKLVDYKRFHEALTLASPPNLNSRTDDVSNTIVEIEYTLKGIGLFTIPIREHQQAKQEILNENPDLDFDEDESEADKRTKGNK